VVNLVAPWPLRFDSILRVDALLERLGHVSNGSGVAGRAYLTDSRTAEDRARRAGGSGSWPLAWQPTNFIWSPTVGAAEVDEWAGRDGSRAGRGAGD
jgi:hypothetical protein